MKEARFWGLICFPHGCALQSPAVFVKGTPDTLLRLQLCGPLALQTPMQSEGDHAKMRHNTVRACGTAVPVIVSYFCRSATT